MGFTELWRSRRTGEPGLLKGVRAICNYCRISPHTFYAWKDNHNFPVAMLPDGRWCTSKVLIDDWVVTLWKAQSDTSECDDVSPEVQQVQHGD